MSDELRELLVVVTENLIWDAQPLPMAMCLSVKCHLKWSDKIRIIFQRQENICRKYAVR